MSTSNFTAESISFPRLNDSNYAEWAVRMEAILIRKGLWSMIETVVETEGKDAATIMAELDKKKKGRLADKMAEARAEMVLRVEDGQLSHMRSRDPMEVWETLQRVHRAAGFATSLALRRKFLTAKKGEAQSMQAWIGVIQSLAFRMEEAQIVVTDQDRILALTMGLPISYNAVIINFDSTPADQLTLDCVITRLLNEETRQAANSVEDESGDQAMAIMGSKFAGRRAARATNASDVTCYFCDKKGHYKSECPKKKEWERSEKQKNGSKSGEEAAGLVEEDSDDEYLGSF
jgi:hypothetical protein